MFSCALRRPQAPPHSPSCSPPPAGASGDSAHVPRAWQPDPGGKAGSPAPLCLLAPAGATLWPLPLPAYSGLETKSQGQGRDLCLLPQTHLGRALSSAPGASNPPCTGQSEGALQGISHQTITFSSFQDTEQNASLLPKLWPHWPSNSP